MKKRIISFMLTLVVLVTAFQTGVINTSAATHYSAGVTTTAELNSRLDALKRMYVGTYWTTNGKPSDGNGSTSKNYHGIQCKGFASFIFNEIFCTGFIGSTDTSQKHYIPSPSGATLVEKAWNISASDTATVKRILSRGQTGDLIQVRRRGKTYGHTMILTGSDSSGVWLFDCNSDGHCLVQHYHQEWKIFAEKNIGMSVYHSTRYPSGGGCSCSDSYAGTYTCTTSSSRLTIRSGHGTGYGTVGYIPSGAKVSVSKASGSSAQDWAHVTYNGVSGYASMQYLRKETYNNPLSLSFSNNNPTMKKGQSTTVNINFSGEGIHYLSASIANSSIVSGTWTSVDYGAGTASISFTGQSSGSTSVTVYLNSESGQALYNKSFNISVSGDPLSLSLSANSLTLNQDESSTVSLSFSGDGIHYISATIDNTYVCSAHFNGTYYQNGKSSITVTGCHGGQTNISVSLMDSSDRAILTKSFTVNVIEPLSMKVNPGEVSLDTGGSQTLTVTYSGQNVKSLSCTNMDTSVCSAKWLSAESGVAKLQITGRAADNTNLYISLIGSGDKTLMTKSIPVSVIYSSELSGVLTISGIHPLVGLNLTDGIDMPDTSEDEQPTSVKSETDESTDNDNNCEGDDSGALLNSSVNADTGLSDNQEPTESSGSDEVTEHFVIAWLNGDADCDKDISIVDTTVIQRYLASMTMNNPEAIERNGDVNQDGLDIIDSTLIQRFLAQIPVPNKCQIGDFIEKAI